MAVAWYCRVGGQSKGPLTPQELKALAAAGQLTPESLVRQGTEGSWVKASRVKGLFAAGAGTTSAKTSAMAETRLDPPKLAAQSGGTQQGPTAGGPSSFDQAFDELAPLPTSSGALPPTGGLPAGLPASSLGGSFELPPAPSAIAQPVAVGQAAAWTGATVRQQPTAADMGRVTAPDFEADEPVRRAVDSSFDLSLARVMGVAIVGLLIGFVGVCTALLPLVPIFLGIVGIIMAGRAAVMSPRKDNITLGLPLMTAIVGLAALLWGLQTTLSSPDPLGRLHAIVGMARSGTSGADEKGNLPPLATTVYDASSQAVPVGDVQLQISEVGLGPVEGFRAVNVDGPAGSVVLSIRLRLENKGPRKVDYASWNGTVVGAPLPTLMDDMGNVYHLVVARGQALSGQVGRTSLEPNKALTDIMVFQRPATAYGHLDLSLPAAALGQNDTIRFRIPRSMVLDLTDRGKSDNASGQQPQSPK